MKSFLTQAAQKLLDSERPLHQTTVVMPSRRAAIFLQRELSKQLEKPQLAPAILTVEELVLQSTGLQSEEAPALLFKAYEAYHQVHAEGESFDEFATWGNLLVADCNEIDRYLIPADNLFGYLADVKRIESWNLEAGESTQLIDNYLALWRLLPKVYRQFTQNLLREGRAYQGLAFRQMAERLPQLLSQLRNEHRHFYFLGFNALNAAEEKIFSALWEEDMAEFLWDVDRYYFEDQEHEAGQFLRQSGLVKKLRQKGEFEGLHRELKSGERKLRSIAVAGNNLQGVVANQLLAAKAKDENLSNTALVLADENLLLAFLHNLHPSIGPFNITMGLALQNSPLAAFFELLLRFQQEGQHSRRRNGKGQMRYHYSKWDELLSSMVLRRCNPQQVSVMEALRQKMKVQNAIYRSYEELQNEFIFSPLSAEFFEPTINPAQYFAALAGLCDNLRPHFSKGQNLTEALYGFFQLFNQLQALLERFPYVEKMDTALRLYRELLPDINLDLHGEPLQGLQVMGMLETRSLDFDHLIICSLNEGVLPKGRTENSLIPFDIKREFGLPTYLDKDAVYAYHFYRLLQRATHIDLLYSTSDKGMGKGEASRFIAQLELEWPAENKAVKMEKLVASGSGALIAQDEEKIEKTPEVMERLRAMGERGFSPTALIQYLRDPVAFYYERVLGLREGDELSEEPEARVQGNVLHALLEEFYSEPVGKKTGERQARSPLADDAIYRYTPVQLREKIRAELLREMREAELNQGPNLLTTETMTLMLHHFLQQEKAERLRENEFEVLAVEAKLEADFDVYPGLRVKLHGNADRIERRNGTLRVVDYKTGAKKGNAYRISSRSKVEPNHGYQKLLQKPDALQLLLYAYLYRCNFESEPVGAAVLSLRKIQENPMSLQYAGKAAMDDEVQAIFETDLRALLQEMFDPKIAFYSRQEEILNDDDDDYAQP